MEPTALGARKASSSPRDFLSLRKNQRTIRAMWTPAIRPTLATVKAATALEPRSPSCRTRLWCNTSYSTHGLLLCWAHSRTGLTTTLYQSSQTNLAAAFHVSIFVWFVRVTGITCECKGPCKRTQQFTLLRVVGGFWPTMAGFKLHATSANIVAFPYKRTQHVGPNNVASVRVGIKCLCLTFVPHVLLWWW